MQPQSAQLAMKKSRVYSVNATSVETNEPIVRKEVEASADRLGVLDVDPDLAPHKEHLLYRFREFKARKEAFEKFEGGLEDFSLGQCDWTTIMENDPILAETCALAMSSLLLHHNKLR